RLRLQDQQAGSREEEGQTPSSDRPDDGSRIARAVVACLPDGLPRALVEGDYTGAVFTTDVDEDEVVFDHRRGTGPEEVHRHLVVVVGRALPDQTPSCEVETGELSLGAVRIDALSVDGGRTTGTIVVAVAIFVCGGVTVIPDRLPGRSFETLDHL